MIDRACRGKHLTLLVRFPNQGRQLEDLDVWSHQNDTLGSLRRQILHRYEFVRIFLCLDSFDFCKCLGVGISKVCVVVDFGMVLYLPLVKNEGRETGRF